MNFWKFDNIVNNQILDQSESFFLNNIEIQNKKIYIWREDNIENINKYLLLGSSYSENENRLTLFNIDCRIINRNVHFNNPYTVMCWLRIIRNQIVPQHKKRMIILSKIEIDKLLDNNILDPELSQYYSKYFFGIIIFLQHQGKNVIKIGITLYPRNNYTQNFTLLSNSIHLKSDWNHLTLSYDGLSSIV